MNQLLAVCRNFIIFASALLWSCGSEDPTLDRWIDIARNGRDYEARMYAVQALARIGIDSARALGALFDVMRNDPDRSVRQMAALELGIIGRKKSVVIDVLKVDLGYRDDAIREQVLLSLAVAGPAAKPAIPALVEVTKISSAHGVAVGALRALAHIGGIDALAAFVRLLDRYDRNTRLGVARMLRKTLLDEGDIPELVLPLTEMLRDKDASVREEAARALVSAGPAGLNAIRTAVSSEKHPGRSEASQVLEEYKSLTERAKEIWNPLQQ